MRTVIRYLTRPFARVCEHHFSERFALLAEETGVQSRAIEALGEAFDRLAVELQSVRMDLEGQSISAAERWQSIDVENERRRGVEETTTRTIRDIGTDVEYLGGAVEALSGTQERIIAHLAALQEDHDTEKKRCWAASSGVLQRLVARAENVNERLLDAARERTVLAERLDAISSDRDVP